MTGKGRMMGGIGVGVSGVEVQPGCGDAVNARGETAGGVLHMISALGPRKLFKATSSRCAFQRWHNKELQMRRRAEQVSQQG